MLMALRGRECSPEQSGRSQLLKDLCRENRTLTVSVQLRRAAISRFFLLNSFQMIRQQYHRQEQTFTESSSEGPPCSRAITPQSGMQNISVSSGPSHAHIE